MRGWGTFLLFLLFPLGALWKMRRARPWLGTADGVMQVIALGSGRSSAHFFLVAPARTTRQARYGNIATTFKIHGLTENNQAVPKKCLE